MNNKLIQVELIKRVQPPVDSAEVAEYIFQLPLEEQKRAALYVINELAKRANAHTEDSIDMSRVIQIDGLASFLSENPAWLKGYELRDQKLYYDNELVTKPKHGTALTPIDILSNALSEHFNYRYKFGYKLLLPALTKAIKLLDKCVYLDAEYVLEVARNMPDKWLPLSAFTKLIPDVPKAKVKAIILANGWESRPTSSKNIFYRRAKPQLTKTLNQNHE